MVDIFGKEIPKSDHRVHLLSFKRSTINNRGRESDRKRVGWWCNFFLWILTTCGCVNKYVTVRLKIWYACVCVPSLLLPDPKKGQITAAPRAFANPQDWGPSVSLCVSVWVNVCPYLYTSALRVKKQNQDILISVLLSSVGMCTFSKKFLRFLPKNPTEFF